MFQLLPRPLRQPKQALLLQPLIHLLARHSRHTLKPQTLRMARTAQKGLRNHLKPSLHPLVWFLRHCSSLTPALVLRILPPLLKRPRRKEHNPKHPGQRSTLGQAPLPGVVKP
mmetsp:Transcript_10159/g.30511  ORF Transcript_10159/g.30511 Transcript_10159/m.30511 type:complete len:113 (+) Transcript_10159:576-914(+)